ncbi:MAG: hypothetical protein JWR50_1765 [Mucilaginibacter sp.]|nr:hypothetical protein [Mucilaginibacter sp.]
MKTTLKNGLLALVIAASFAACKGKGSASSADSVKTDSSSVTSVTDSVKKDTSSAVPDSLKKDTAISTQKTEVKTKTTETHKKK